MENLNPTHGEVDLYQMINVYIEFCNTKGIFLELGEVPSDLVYATKRMAS